METVLGWQFISSYALENGKEPEGYPTFFTPFLSDDHILSPDAVAIPIIRAVQTPGITGPLLGNQGSQGVERLANLSSGAEVYLAGLGITSMEGGPKLWMHVLSITMSPAYLSENADGVKRNWPRVPLPSDLELLEKSSNLGQTLASLLDPEACLTGVTIGNIREELRNIANLSLIGTTPLDPGKDLKLTKGWGRKGRNGVNPGRGKAILREYTFLELESIKAGASSIGLNLDEALNLIGKKTYDVYLNDRTYWANIPENVWECYIGGYQIIKKWLSYREAKALGRPINLAEADLVRDIARRITALRLLGPKLDANYVATKSNTYDWSQALTQVPITTFA